MIDSAYRGSPELSLARGNTRVSKTTEILIIPLSNGFKILANRRIRKTVTLTGERSVRTQENLIQHRTRTYFSLLSDEDS